MKINKDISNAGAEPMRFLQIISYCPGKNKQIEPHQCPYQSTKKSRRRKMKNVDASYNNHDVLGAKPSSVTKIETKPQCHAGGFFFSISSS